MLRKQDLPACRSTGAYLMGRFYSENFSGVTSLLNGGSSCAQQKVAAGTNRSRDPGARSPFDSLQILAVADEQGNGAAQPTEAGGVVVPTDLERSEVKIEFFNYGIHGRAVRRARDQHGRLRLARPDGFAGVRPPAKQ